MGLLPSGVETQGWRDTGDLGDHSLDRMAEAPLHTHIHTGHTDTHMHVFWKKQTLPEGAGRGQVFYRDLCPHAGPVKTESTFVVPGVAMVLRVWLPRLGTWIPPDFSRSSVHLVWPRGF